MSRHKFNDLLNNYEQRVRHLEEQKRRKDEFEDVCSIELREIGQ